MNSCVGIRLCSDYSNCYSVIKSVLSDIGFLPLFEQKKVLLKVNLVTARNPQEAVNTHPEFVRGVIKVIKENGGRPFIAESSGTFGFTNEAFEISGISQVARQTNTRIVNFDLSKLVKCKINGKILKEVYLPEDVLNADIKISLPKLKTHDFMLLSAAIKNQVGVFPGSYKCNVHKLASTPLKMAQLLVELNQYLKFNLAIVDGVISMEGNGPVLGKPINSSFICAGEDLVAVDTVCSVMMGIDPKRVLTNRIGELNGFGNASFNNINLRGDKIDQARLKKFILPKPVSKFANILFRLKFFLKSIAITPVTIKNLCRACKTCQRGCPVEAIKINDLSARNKNCIRCYNCYSNCPSKAIKLKCKWYLKYLFKQSAKGMALKDLL